MVPLAVVELAFKLRSHPSFRQASPMGLVTARGLAVLLLQHGEQLGSQAELRQVALLPRMEAVFRQLAQYIGMLAAAACTELELACLRNHRCH